MASRAGGSIGRGAGRAQGSAPGSPPRPMQGRVGDGPGGAGAIFVGGLLTVPAPTSRRSFRYDGPRPPPSGQTQTQPKSGSEEEDEEEDGEGEKEEDTEGSGDDSEAAWDPETHGGGEGGDDDDEDHEMDRLEPEGREEEVGEGGGRAATEAGSQHVREGGGSVGVKVGGRKTVTIREPRQRKKANKLRERAYPCTFTGEPLGEGVIAPEFLDEDGGSESSKGTGKGETFPRGGYKGVLDGYVYQWPHAKTWPQLAKGKGMPTGGGHGSGGMERWMTTKLTSVQLRQAITKLVVTCDLPFRIVEAEDFRELLILLNRNCAQKNFIPSRWTVSRDTVVYAAAALQSAIAEMLAKEGELGCRVSFTIDMWSAPNNRAWLVVTGHWIDENYQLCTMVFEFREIHGRHTGKQMARVVEETVVQWGLETRCLGFTSDNASSNTTAFRWMSEEGGGQCFFNSRMHFRYLLLCSRVEGGVMASRGGGSIGRGAGRAQGSAPGSPPRPMQGRVGDGPGGAGAIFVGGLLTVPAPTSRRSFRYDGPRPPPSGQTPTQPESGSEEEDEEEDGEGEKEENTEGSGDDSEAAWDPETHGGGEGGDDDDEDHEMDGLEPEGREEEVREGGGRAATEAGSQHVREGGGSVGVKVGGGKAVTIREPKQRKKANKLRERAYPCTFTGEPLGEGVIPPEFLDEDGGSKSSKGTSKGGYKGVPDGYVYQWPHAKTWPQLAKGKAMATGGGDGSGGIERWMTAKLTSVQLRQAITKLVVTCDLPFRIVEAEAFRKLLILLNRNCAQKNFIPSRWTVSRDTVVYSAAALQSAIAEMLAKEGELGCRVSFTIDMWTSPNNRTWLVVTGHWIDEGYQLRTMVFEFREIHGRHTGKQMARVVEDTVVQWGLETRCLGFTSDNASSNTAAFRWMSEEGDAWHT
ncbi:unnamed protein product [Closterium sp. NIES-65]|nr:unnamed protein product [Closterium sp. NIES-65]